MFTNDFDIEISQLVDMGNPRKGANRLRVKIKPPSGETTASGLYNRMARAADYQVIGQWEYVSNSQGPNYRHTLGSGANDQYLFWRFSGINSQLDLYEVFAEQNGRPNEVHCASFSNALMTVVGFKPQGSANDGAVFIERTSPSGFLRRGTARWQWKAATGN